MTPDPTAIPVDGRASEGAIVAAYAIVGARRTSFDTMMWQVPALATAAQAFLLTIALGPDSQRAAQTVAATLGAILAGLSAQLMAKYRHLETSDSRLAERIERQLGLDGSLGAPPHAPARIRLGDKLPWWVRMSSYRLWILGIAAFGVADLAVALDAVAGIGLFD
ncbi:hypothetical protein [Micromonospora sp. NBC_01796]|uniref:hypothetical protein n=1 Tax=Micromonospora sp. NBC_01796 TaxID=2975987 RepID=UPI002DD82D51|nr:hypothetical protein [Micromonospora sp. NBC_01796]WSA85293.1 hypothetical protein OIE47_33900 [Micromonospora sp. NBC_01796]